MSVRLKTRQGEDLSIAFDPGWTVASLLAAVVIIATGFTLAGEPQQVKVWRTCLVGIVGGCGVAAMHYLGMYGGKRRNLLAAFGTSSVTIYGAPGAD